MTDDIEREHFIGWHMKEHASPRRVAAHNWDNSLGSARAWQARAALDTAPERKVDEKCPACNGTGHRDGPSYSDPQKMNMYGCQVCKSSGIIRTTKPADAGQLVAFAEWLSGRSPETFWVTAVDESGPSYMDAKEAVAWFLMQQQKGERRE